MQHAKKGKSTYRGRGKGERCGRLLALWTRPRGTELRLQICGTDRTGKLLLLLGHKSMIVFPSPVTEEVQLNTSQILLQAHCEQWSY
ncbi:unnamed protein product [Boreogadus saida]